MAYIVDLLVFFVIVLGIGFVLARIATRSRSVKVPDLELNEGQIFRLLTTTGNYRSQLVSLSNGALQVSAPLHRDCHVPLRVGETVIVQSPGFDSLLTFRTTVVARDPSTHELTLAAPQAFRRTDRRCEARVRHVKGQEVTLVGRPAVLQDLSAWGTKLTTSERLKPGDYVSMELTPEFGVARGYVLEVRTSSWEGRLCYEVRIRFEDPLSGLAPRLGRRLVTL